MTDRRFCCLTLSCLLIAGCGQPAEDQPADPPAAAEPGPAAPEPEVKPAGEPTPTADAAPADSLAQVTYDETTDTRSGQVAFSAAEHVLKVTQGEHVTYYNTGPVADELTAADQQRLLGALAETFRYPADRTSQVRGTFVRELGGDENELVAVGFQTSDSVATAAQFYDSRLSRSPTPIYRVAVPAGNQEVITYVAGLGARRYRVVLEPAEAGCFISVTQSYLAGAPTVDFMAGQGVLGAASGTG